jgi:hypothetical protein
MTKFILAITTALMLFSAPVFAEATTKKECVKQKDAKTGKEKEVCKTIKVHKKLEVQADTKK